MSNPHELIKDRTLEFIFKFSNADEFYISARRALACGWVAVGCSNAHQSIELYIKAILKLHSKEEKEHDLVKLLKKYSAVDTYFSVVLNDIDKVVFLDQLSQGYLSHRYGETGSKSNLPEIITFLDELAFNLRRIYIKTMQYSSNKIYMPTNLAEEFLLNNACFTISDITNNPIARNFPIDMELPKDWPIKF